MSACHDSSNPLPRQVADSYVDDLIALDPISGTFLGVKESYSRLPDFSPAGQAALAELARGTLAELDAAERRPGGDSDVERRCGRLLRERLTAELAVHEADEPCAPSATSHSPAHAVREVFTVTPDRDRRGLGGVARAAARRTGRPRGLPGVAGARPGARSVRGARGPTATFVGQLERRRVV